MCVCGPGTDSTNTVIILKNLNRLYVVSLQEELSALRLSLAQRQSEEVFKGDSTDPQVRFCHIWMMLRYMCCLKIS